MHDKENIKIIKEEDCFVTKGLNSYSQKEIKIKKVDIDEELAKNILLAYAKKIIDGNSVPTQDNTMLNCTIFFKEDSDYIYIIFPDPFGKFPWDKDCLQEYKKQIF